MAKANLRDAVTAFKASKAATDQAIRNGDFSSGREFFAKATKEFVDILTSSCQDFIVLLLSDYERAYDGIKFVCKECFLHIPWILKDQKSNFYFVQMLNDAMLPPRDVNAFATIFAENLNLPSLIEQSTPSVNNSNKLANLINSFPKMEIGIRLLLLHQIRFLQTPGSLREAKILKNIGIVYQSKGDLDKALKYYQSSLQIKNRLTPGSLGEAKTLSNIGGVYRSMGDHDRALQDYKFSSVILQQLAPGSLDEAKALNNVGIVYESKGNLDRALQYYESSLLITQRLAVGSLEKAATLNNIGGVYRSKGDLNRALQNYKSAQFILHRLAPGSLDEAKALQNIGIIIRSKGDLDRALYFYDLALKITHQLAPGSLEESVILNNIGSVYKHKGELDTALEKYTEVCSLEYFKSVSGRDSWNLAEANQKKASLLFTLFRIDDSIQLLQNVMALDESLSTEFKITNDFMDYLSHTKFLTLFRLIVPSNATKLFKRQSEAVLDTQPLLSILYADEALKSATRSNGSGQEIVAGLINAICKLVPYPIWYGTKLAEKFSVSFSVSPMNCNHPLQVELEMLKYSFMELRCQYHKSLSVNSDLTFIDDNMAGSFFTQFLSLLDKIFRFWIETAVKDFDKSTELYFLNCSSYKALKAQLERYDPQYDFKRLDVNLPPLLDVLKFLGYVEKKQWTKKAFEENTFNEHTFDDIVIVESVKIGTKSHNCKMMAMLKTDAVGLSLVGDGRCYSHYIENLKMVVKNMLENSPFLNAENKYIDQNADAKFITTPCKGRGIEFWKYILSHVIEEELAAVEIQSYLIGDNTVLNKANEWIVQQAKPKSENLIKMKMEDTITLEWLKSYAPLVQDCIGSPNDDHILRSPVQRKALLAFLKTQAFRYYYGTEDKDLRLDAIVNKKSWGDVIYMIGIANKHVKLSKHSRKEDLQQQTYGTFRKVDMQIMIENPYSEVYSWSFRDFFSSVENKAKQSQKLYELFRERKIINNKKFWCYDSHNHPAIEAIVEDCVLGKTVEEKRGFTQLMEVLQSLSFDEVQNPNEFELKAIARYVEDKVLMNASLKQHSSERIDFIELMETALSDTEEWLVEVFNLTPSFNNYHQKKEATQKETPLGLVPCDWNSVEEHKAFFASNRRNYFLRVPPSFDRSVAWYFDRYRLLKDGGLLSDPSLFAWYVHTLETLMDIISPRNPETKEFQLSIVDELSKIYRDHSMWDDHKRIRKQYYKYSHEKDVFPTDNNEIISDGRKQLAYCQLRLWSLERFSPQQPNLLVSIQSLVVEVIVKLRQMAEQCIQKFASEMIHWPNREQYDANQGGSFKCLYGAKRNEDFDKALRVSKLESKGLEDCKMDFATHFPTVLEALLKAQPFCEGSTGEVPKHWWHIIIIISNICKHSRQLDISYDDSRDRDELRIIVPLHGFDAMYDKKPLVEKVSVCELIRAALRGFGAIVGAIDESKRETEEMHAVASTGKGSLRKYLDAGVPMDRLSLRRESCFHLCAKRGDLDQLRVLVEDRQALRRALFQKDREHKRTMLHYMYLNHFMDGISLVQSNVDVDSFDMAMRLEDKGRNTPDLLDKENGDGGVLVYENYFQSLESHESDAALDSKLIDDFEIVEM